MSYILLNSSPALPCRVMNICHCKGLWSVPVKAHGLYLWTLHTTHQGTQGNQTKPLPYLFQQDKAAITMLQDTQP